MLRKPLIVSALAVCAAIGIGNVAAWFIRECTTSASNACINNLRQLDGAKQQWALEHNKTTNDLPSWDDIRPYIKLTSSGALPPCTKGGTYTLGRVDEPPRCTVMEHNMDYGSVTVIDESGLP